MKNYRIRFVVFFTVMITALIAQTGLACEAGSAITRLENATYTGIEDNPATLKDKQLEEGKTEVTGLLSLSVLEGSEWILTRMNREQPVPEDAEVTLSFDSGRISGRSACNRYSADIKEGDSAGEILIGPTMGTRMACPDHLMEIESMYLEALAKVTSFSFYSGKLMLNGQKEDETPFSMLFTATGAGPQVEL
ncbi:MAG: META domain-containing protein [Xanthomonadales bacterium]|nr:META domain-containing protein [Xanthomonadales bacterium]